MRVSIWQQFSSNHSAGFTVVGVFQHVAAAQQAASELMVLMREINDWYKQHEDADSRVSAGGVTLTSPERVYATKHNIPWIDGDLDWVWIDKDGNGPVKVVEHIVFINGAESWLGAFPANALMAHFGSKVLIDGSVNGQRYCQIYLNLTCEMPDEATAQKIYGSIKNYWSTAEQNHQSTSQAPWNDKPWPSSFKADLHIEGGYISFKNGRFYLISEEFPQVLRYFQKHSAINIRCIFEERDLEEQVPSVEWLMLVEEQHRSLTQETEEADPWLPEFDEEHMSRTEQQQPPWPPAPTSKY